MIKKYLFIFLIFISVKLTAQRTNSSPYSFFGIGEQFNTKTTEQASMGGIGVAYSNNYHLNFTNPAANANLRFATYTFGLLNNDLSIKDNSETQSSISTSLNYFGFGAPIGKKAGFSIGMQPISSVGYSLTNQLEDSDGNISEITFFSGSGGVNRLYGSFGMEVSKNILVGIEADFIFGKIENNIIKSSADVFLATKYKKTAIIRGGSIRIGTQYKKNLNKNLRLDVGAVVKLENNLTANGTELLYSLTATGTGAEIPRDTVHNATIKGNFIFPIQTTIGIGLGQGGKWYTGIEYEFKEAINANGYLDGNLGYAYSNSNRVSLGGFYIPKANSISSYWDRVSYRAGIRFEKTGLLVNGTTITDNFTAINDFGISFGIGLPLGNRLSNLNAGFEFGKKGTTNNNLLEENYFNLRLSLSLNDLNWFKKRRID